MLETKTPRRLIACRPRRFTCVSGSLLLVTVADAYRMLSSAGPEAFPTLGGQDLQHIQVVHHG